MRTFLSLGLILLLGAAALLGAAPASDLYRLDFEQTFYVHPGWEVWDFCVVEDDSLYHLYYHTRPEGASNSYPIRRIEHAVSPDLAHWTLLDPALTWEEHPYQAMGMWAPHVVRDSLNDRWVMAYTAVDSQLVQRACIAYSPDLSSWTQEPANPVFEPDTLAYTWNPDEPWSSCRDPFLYREDGQWSMLNTVRLRVNGYPGNPVGAVVRATSPDLVTWTDAGPVFVHDGTGNWHDLESCHYLQRDGVHHLFFTEYANSGVSHVAASEFGDWTMAERTILEDASAPELIPVGSDRYVIGRYVTYQHAYDGHFSFVLRFDTLGWNAPDAPVIVKPNPLNRDWVSFSGTATLGNPVYGDNPVERGSPSEGHTGNFWYSSREYYRGPQSGVGAPGAMLGDFALGVMEGRPFPIQGDVIDLLVGGGDYPGSCYVALVDVDSGLILASSTGGGTALMTPRQWDVGAYLGRTAAIRIVDAANGAMGWISVDQIVEGFAASAASAPPPPVEVLAAPNPFNPRTEFRFALGGPARARIEIHDLRGRRLWTSAEQALEGGRRSLAWDGRDAEGRDLPSGAYLYRLVLDGRAAASGRVLLAR
ncbi:MAG TPA: hypothetical protein PLH84_11040 [Candidatus Krumholzibacteria bacterium]|nr:hypothetical protein [Candidatus Krumholzibacteria bacterium]